MRYLDALSLSLFNRTGRAPRTRKEEKKVFFYTYSCICFFCQEVYSLWLVKKKNEENADTDDQLERYLLLFFFDDEMQHRTHHTLEVGREGKEARKEKKTRFVFLLSLSLASQKRKQTNRKSDWFFVADGKHPESKRDRISFLRSLFPFSLSLPSFVFLLFLCR